MHTLPLLAQLHILTDMHSRLWPVLDAPVALAEPWAKLKTAPDVVSNVTLTSNEALTLGGKWLWACACGARRVFGEYWIKVMNPVNCVSVCMCVICTFYAPQLGQKPDVHPAAPNCVIKIMPAHPLTQSKTWPCPQSLLASQLTSARCAA